MPAEVQTPINCEDMGLNSLLGSALACKLECKFCKSGLSPQRHVASSYSPVGDVTASHSFLDVSRNSKNLLISLRKKYFSFEKENNPILTS